MSLPRFVKLMANKYGPYALDEQGRVWCHSTWRKTHPDGTTQQWTGWLQLDGTEPPSRMPVKRPPTPEQRAMQEVEEALQ